MKLLKGDIVKINSSFRGSGEGDELYLVCEVNGDRATITPVEFNGSFKPIELVGTKMLKFINRGVN